MALRPLPSLLPEDMDSPVSPAARHVKVGQGRFGWWVGVLNRNVAPHWDIWHCGHQHATAGEARECVGNLIYVICGESGPVRLRK